MNEQTKKDFLKEFKALLEKYDVDIYIELHGDTHGVSANLIVDISNNEVIRHHDGISHHDIKI